MCFHRFGMEQKETVYEKWTDGEVQALLSVFAETEIQRDIESTTRKAAFARGRPISLRC